MQVSASNKAIIMALSELTFWSHGRSPHLVTIWQLFSDIFAMGVHREPKDALQIPWFLDDIRTRLFACVYDEDKTLSDY